MASPWKKTPAESSKAYQAFNEYCNLGPDRSLAVVGQRLGKSTDLMERWSARHGWVERAAAWDEYMAAVERRAAALLAQERAKIWLERDEKRRERRYLLGEQLLEKVEAALKFPLATKIVEPDGAGGTRTIIKPAKWSLGQVARMAQAGFVLQGEAIRNEGSIQGEVGDERPEEWLVDDFTPEDADE